ncbi:A/G-specific adenine glycosylase [Phaeodactylibacter luteus]|uniref:Adenine DNA glycosylase n=1 Tax=Phaeodactylibacter luteus TaxID=1564516 RepID=A0A5C6RIR5_9BACT|nr:A/G-specific adenine glycosylase [Phaeodactylibacter luteus]TXB62013.1 A/G-specific adenine glycosylase [Phaeodactylibacter luteus]
MKQEKLHFFTERLAAWFAGNHRPLPWKGEQDPYRIWLSEIILQQTRVEQGMPYFERFCREFPTVADLAAAPEDAIMKAWEGLGYYSRARNLHAAAKYVAYERGGVFPATYEGIRQLKGVGPYTAAAIASFAYGLPYAVVDGNVYRVLSRFGGIAEPIDSAGGKKTFAQLAQRALEVAPLPPGSYNQAIMDFGATHCKPKAPFCTDCPLSRECSAFQKGKVGLLPVKEKKIKRKKRFFHYLVANYGAEVLIHKRTGRDIWQNLYEFPLLEWPEAAASEEQIRRSAPWATLIGDRGAVVRQVSPPQQQALTHQQIQAVFWEVEVEGPPPAASELGPFIRAERKNLSKFAFPKIIDCYLGDNSLYLKLV